MPGWVCRHAHAGARLPSRSGSLSLSPGCAGGTAVGPSAPTASREDATGVGRDLGAPCEAAPLPDQARRAVALDLPPARFLEAVEPPA